MLIQDKDSERGEHGMINAHEAGRERERERGEGGKEREREREIERDLRAKIGDAPVRRSISAVESLLQKGCRLIDSVRTEAIVRRMGYPPL